MLMYRFAIGRFEIRAEIFPSHDVDVSWCETGETAANLESGLWEAFDTKVSVLLNGVEIGADWLCQSIYADPTEFFSSHRDPDPMNRNCTVMRAAWRGEGNPDAKVSICHYFPGMVSQAIAEARQWIASSGMAQSA